MKKTMFTVVFTAIMLIGFEVNTSAQQVRWQPPFQVPEFNNYNQGWAGFTQYDWNSRTFVITYNPRIMERMRAPWFMYVWLRVHEYGHVNRIQVGDQSESGADCWAAQQLGRTDPEIVRLVVDYFIRVQGPYAADQAHGTGYQQAALIRQCSGV